MKLTSAQLSLSILTLHEFDGDASLGGSVWWGEKLLTADIQFSPSRNRADLSFYYAGTDVCVFNADLHPLWDMFEWVPLIQDVDWGVPDKIKALL